MDADLIRWGITGLGIVAIAVIVFLSRRRGFESGEQSTDELLGLKPTAETEGTEENSLSSEFSDDDLLDEGPGLFSVDNDSAPDLPELKSVSSIQPEPFEYHEPEKIINMCVLAKSGELLEGADIYRCLTLAGVRPGDMEIFHGMTKEGRIGFSVASAVEPGTLIPSQLNHFQTPGLHCFMQLPGPFNSLEQFESMLKAVTKLAQDLDADLRDGSRQRLTAQVINAMRDEVIEFERRRKLKVNS